MYAWIWRHLPFGLPGKIIGSMVLIATAVSLLWFWVFPATAEWVERVILPFDQSTLDVDPAPGAPDAPAVDGEAPPGDDQSPAVDDDGTPLPDEHDIPYDTDG